MASRCLRLLFHPATVLALIALFVGAAGGAFATASGLIGSPQIKDHSIKLIDLSPQAVRGLRGRVGPQGPTGTFDPTKVTVLKVRRRWFDRSKRKAPVFSARRAVLQSAAALKAARIL
jgi:hypothetical protein